MGAQEQLLADLLQETHAGPVFGPGVAFGELTPERRDAIFTQTNEVIQLTAAEMGLILPTAFPDATPKEIGTSIKQVTTKAGAFMAALSAGELLGQENTRKLTLATTAVGYMYIADQSIDRGDESMATAVEFRYGNHGMRLSRDRPGEAADRTKLLLSMEAAIEDLSEDDTLAVIECYADLVLSNEARLYRHSAEYDRLRHVAQPLGRMLGCLYLGRQAATVADIGVADAGFQSVTSSLHTIYSQNDPNLPSIAELHSDPSIRRALRVCNAVARVADERGDYRMDAGSDPNLGIFTINPFNQYHPKMVERFCRLAGINDNSEISAIQTHFKVFNRAKEDDEASRAEHGAAITDRFFRQMTSHVNALETSFPAPKYERYEQYIILMRRVGEICAVNMRGDPALSGA